MKWRDFPGGPVVKNSPANGRDKVDPWSGGFHIPQGNY